MKKGFRLPPFEVNRTLHTGLAVQLADALRSAIRTGYYASGEVLPPIRDLSAITGVSQVLVSRAIRMLREERLIAPRPHVGCVVCAKKRPLWKGQVLIVVPAGIGNPADNAIYSVLRDTLTANGFLPLSVTVPRFPNGTFDFALLGAMLRQQTDLVVQLHDKDDIAQYLARCKIPFIRFSKGSTYTKNCVGIIHRRSDLALDDFVRHCRERSVRNVLQVSVKGNGPDAVPALQAAGIRAENWYISPPLGSHDAMGLVQCATDAFVERFSGKGRNDMPDLLFFNDDHLTVGAFMSFISTGIRVPEDVSVVTWANTGLGPAFVKPLTRMEQDNSAIGEKVAECVLKYLRTGNFPADVAVGPKYVIGESF